MRGSDCSSDSDEYSDAGSVACSIAPTKAVAQQGGGAKAPSCVLGKPMMARPPFEVCGGRLWRSWDWLVCVASVVIVVSVE